MPDLQTRYDNQRGEPMFEPYLTGDSLQGKALQDWVNFCTAVVQADEPLYNTWFENRYYRVEHERAQSVVNATEHNGMICIRCPTKVWANELLGHMGKWRQLSGRKFWILAPGEDAPKPFSPEQTERDILAWEAHAREGTGEHTPSHYRLMAAQARKSLERHRYYERGAG